MHVDIGCRGKVAVTKPFLSCASDADTEYPHVETAMTLYDCGIEDVFLTSTSGNITVEISPTGEIQIM